MADTFTDAPERNPSRSTGAAPGDVSAREGGAVKAAPAAETGAAGAAPVKDRGRGSGVLASAAPRDRRDSGARGANPVEGGGPASGVSRSGDPFGGLAADGRVVDVWSRTAPKYRIRAVALLIVNIALFSGLCAFTHWLHVGRLLDFSWRSYAEPARFWGDQTRSLNDFILFPINVQQLPIHGLVLGMLLASIVAVPIVTSILYRFTAALPFIAAVLLFAHMPWMALTLMMSCILAGVRPFRMKFRFGSALLGMLPVLLYLYLATRGAPEQYGAYTSPMQRTLLVAPWVIAILSACLMMGLILLIARLVNYRPGAITPVVTVMFAMPVVLFYRFVGTDELAYRVLESNYGPRSARFEPVQDTRVTKERIYELMQRWTLDEEGGAAYRPEFLAVWSGQVDTFKRRVWQNFVIEFLADRALAYQECARFIATWPDSRYVANVLYVQGLALDTRLDERRLQDAPPRRELYTDFPHAQSESAWTALLSRYPDSPFAIAAGYRLAQLRLRRGEVDAAAELLERVCRVGRGRRAPSATQPSLRGVSAAPPEASLEFDATPYLFEAERLLELIAANRDDPRYGHAPLAALASLDPHRRSYLERLLALAAEWRDSRLYDNLLVTWASGLADAEQRADRLAACAENFPNGDAAPEALFRWADLEIQSLGGKEGVFRDAGVARMRDVATRFGATVWGRAAAERLQMLRSVPARTIEAAKGP